MAKIYSADDIQIGDIIKLNIKTHRPFLYTGEITKIYKEEIYINGRYVYNMPSLLRWINNRSLIIMGRDTTSGIYYAR